MRRLCSLCTRCVHALGRVVAGRFWCSYAWVSLTPTTRVRPRAPVFCTRVRAGARLERACRRARARYRARARVRFPLRVRAPALLLCARVCSFRRRCGAWCRRCGVVWRLVGVLRWWCSGGGGGSYLFFCRRCVLAVCAGVVCAYPFSYRWCSVVVCIVLGIVLGFL